MHCISAEVPVEIAVLLENDHGYVAASQKIPEHHARRSAADDAARCFSVLVAHIEELTTAKLTCVFDRALRFRPVALEPGRGVRKQ